VKSAGPGSAGGNEAPPRGRSAVVRNQNDSVRGPQIKRRGGGPPPGRAGTISDREACNATTDTGMTGCPG